MYISLNLHFRLQYRNKKQKKIKKEMEFITPVKTISLGYKFFIPFLFLLIPMYIFPPGSGHVGIESNSSYIELLRDISNISNTVINNINDIKENLANNNRLNVEQLRELVNNLTNLRSKLMILFKLQGSWKFSRDVDMSSKYDVLQFTLSYLNGGTNCSIEQLETLYKNVNEILTSVNTLLNEN